MKKIFIIGSGGFSKQVIEIIELMNHIKREYELVGLIDDNIDQIGKSVLGYEVIGTTADLNKISLKEEIYGVIAIADGLVKEIISDKLKNVKWENLIHPKAIISNYYNLGKGNIICGGVIINPECKLGNHCHVNIGTTIGHDVSIKDFVTIMPGANISGSTKIGKRVLIGTGSIILQQLYIESDVILGAGATLIEDAKKCGVYVGIPAKIVK